MQFTNQNDVHFDLDRALESGDLYTSIQVWRQRMQIAIRQDMQDSDEKGDKKKVMESIHFEIAYEDLIESLVITIGSLQRRLVESKLTLEGGTERVTLEEGGLS